MKFTTNPAILKGNYGRLKKWSEKGIPTAVDHGYEEEGGVEQFPFIYGISADILWANASNLGIRSRPFIDNCANAYRKWLAEQERKDPTAQNKASNVVFEFKTGRFIYIDAD
jgi:hypothetical protein